MAHYIQLFDKSGDGKEPTPFNTIDEQLCAAMNVPVDTDKYYLGWYSTIGWLSLNHPTLADILSYMESEVEVFPAYEVKVMRWLDKNYSLNTWNGY